jgi:hypothetical protein
VRLAAASTPVFINLSHLVECRNWCARALDGMEENRRGSALELELQGALGLALMFTRGNSPAAWQALSRAGAGGKARRSVEPASHAGPPAHLP